MIELYVSGQLIKLYTPVIAADTLHYLTGQVHFTDGAWEGFAKWIHFTQGEGPDATVYDIALADDAFDESAELNLTVGEWSVYLTGTKDGARLTTVPLVLTVKESGLVDAPLHVMPLSVAEQIDAKASTALDYASAVKAAYDAGELKGEDGKSFVIRGYYDTYAELIAAVPEPEAGEAFGVGTTHPYDIYVWDELNGAWKNNGPISGAKGDRGDAGATFTPSVDASGNLSWTNDGGLENPQTRNIMGPTGATGPAGEDGQSPYEAAVEAGYTGTEATFYAALAAVPYHNARHLPNGADPITVQKDNLANAAVTADKIAGGAVTKAKLGSDVTIQAFGIGYGTCATAAGMAAKAVTMANYNLVAGGLAAVKFTYAVPANATLNINGKGAKDIYWKGAKIVANVIRAGDTATFVYTGSQYFLLAVDRAADWKLLWTNSSPTSTFAAQTVSLSALANYSEFLIIFKHFGSDAVAAGMGTTTCVGRIDGYEHVARWAGSISGAAAITFYQRSFTPKTGGVQFYECKNKNTNSTSAAATGNNDMIPYQIYAR